MGLKEWRLRRSMTDPVRGEFRLSGEYFAYPGSTSRREMLTGVISGPGVTPTAVEQLDDGSGRRFGHDVLPVLVDRADPTRFLVLWDEIPKPDYRAQARGQAEQEAARMRSRTEGDGAAPYGAAPYGDPGPDAEAPSSGGEVPPWAREMLSELGLGGAHVVNAGSQVIDGGTYVVDLTRGHLSSAAASELAAAGRATTAVLLSVTEVPVPQIALPGPTASLCDLVLRVTRPDGASYEAGTRLGFRDARRRAAIAVVGATLPVRVDPADETRVAVDVAAFDAQHPQA